jgi:peptide deformylase
LADPIVIWPDQVLTHPTQPVTRFGDELDALLARMQEAVTVAEGIGIAANQIGVPLRVALVGREDGTFFEIVNPTILERAEPVKLREGCLSVPEQFEEVARFRRVRVRYQDRRGQWQEVTAEDRLAHVFQHEVDHLDGHVFVELLSQLKRGLIRSRMQKLRKSKGEG